MSGLNVDSQYLNMAKLTETFMDNMDIIKQVLSSFKGSFENFEQEFIEAQQSIDNEQMTRLAHGLKGSAGNIRAEGLSQKASELQRKLEGGESPGILAEEVIVDLAGLLREIDSIVDAQ
jgi:HPt (histidine-containing phosphotransfer) domain-containing protein